MNAEDVLVLTPDDDLNSQNEPNGKDKTPVQEPFESVKNTSIHVDENESFVDLNGNSNQEDLLKSDENGEILESGEIDEIKNKDIQQIKIDENLLNEIKYLFKNTRYFLIKSNNYENVQLAQNKVI